MTVQNLLLVLTTFGILAGAIPVNTRRQVADLSIAVIEGSSDATELALSQASEALYLFHSRLGQDGTTALVESDVAAADAFWHATVSNSTGGYVVGKTRIQALAPPEVFNAASIQTWFIAGSTGWPNDFLETSASHYLSFAGDGTSDDQAFVETIEGWGKGPITSSRGILEEKPSFLPDLDEFPEDGKMTLALTLRDGTVFAHSLTASRDLPDGSGVEIFQGIWVPDSTPAYVVEGLTEHITVEFINWLGFAYKKATAA